MVLPRVIPAEAGNQSILEALGPRLRGDDGSHSLHAHPGLGAAEGADGAAHFQLPAALDGREAQGVFATVLRVEDLAAFPDVLALGLLRVADDLHAFDALALAIVLAFLADGVGLGVLLQRLHDVAEQLAALVLDADLGLRFAGLVVDVAPRADGGHLREGAGGEHRQAHDEERLHARAASVSRRFATPERAVRISDAVSGNRRAK